MDQAFLRLILLKKYDIVINCIGILNNACAKEDVTEIYNLVNNTSISKLELLILFNKTLLNNRNDFSFAVPSYEQMIFEMKEWIYSHKSLYPHYFSED
jgi:dTDP-4-dehydrorhamnose reductase